MTELKKLYPVRLCEYEQNAEDENLVTVLYKNTKPTFIEKLFFKKQLAKPVKIDLDEIGSYIWLKCDGTRNVEELISEAKDYFGEKIEPAESRSELFINQLVKNKLAVLYKKVQTE